MSSAEWIGSSGVLILLFAYLLSILKIITPQAGLFLVMNAVGAGLSTLASYLIHYIPFVVLEGIWMLVSIIALFNKAGNKPSLQTRG